MINILIADRNINYSVKLLNNICTKNSNIRITNITRSLEDMYKLINTSYFDIILIDFKLLSSTNVDETLTSFMKTYQQSIILLKSTTTKTRKFSQFTFAMKDDFNNLFKTILELTYLNDVSKSIRDKIKEELCYLGYSYNIIGTTYLTDIIYLIYCTEFEGSLNQSIYPYIAEKYNKAINTIKCDIIHATRLMFDECPKERLMNYLGKCTYYKPGPKTIIYTVINKISA